MNKKNMADKLILMAVLFQISGRAYCADFPGFPAAKEIAAQAALSSFPEPVSRAVTRAPEKEWTIMVYMNGKNNLSGYIQMDMNEMEVVGPPANSNIVVQYARREVLAPPPNGGGYDGPPLPDYPMFSAPAGKTRMPSVWGPGQRYLIEKDGGDPKISSRLVEEIGIVDMGDYKALAEFGKWAKINYPAKKYMLIVWNHGGGWRSKGRVPDRGISYDDETGRNISTVQLGWALEAMGGVDIYASDACLMQMAEVAYEIKKYAGVVVGSEETEPAAGWPYNLFLARAGSVQGPLSSEALAAAAVAGFHEMYFGAGEGATLSALHTDALGGMREILDQWVDLAMSENREIFTSARDSATRFGGADSKDLAHFLKLVLTKAEGQAFKAKTEELIKKISSEVVFASANSGLGYFNTHGLAVYLPSGGYDQRYDILSWAMDSQWDSFVRWLTAPAQNVPPYL